MSHSIQDLTPREVLALAIEVERSNARRYRAFAATFQGYEDDVSSRFEELAREEEEHEAMLIQRHHEAFGGEIPKVEEAQVNGVIEAVDLDDPEALIFDSTTPEKVYRAALAAEEGARMFYRYAASNAADNELGALFWALAGVEGEHVRWLEEKLKEAPPPGQPLSEDLRCLEDGIDYLYCPVCKAHIPCLRLPSGGWEVQCPGCSGECGLCKCYLQVFCFGSREQFPPFEPSAGLAGGGK